MASLRRSFRDISGVMTARDGRRAGDLNVARRPSGGRRGAWTAVVVLALGASGCAGTQTPPTQITSSAEGLFNGQVRADVACYKCHNGDGGGTVRGPNLAKRVPHLTDDEIVEAIAEGPGLMPSFKDKVSDAEARQLAAWLHTKFPR